MSVGAVRPLGRKAKERPSLCGRQLKEVLGHPKESFVVIWGVVGGLSARWPHAPSTPIAPQHRTSFGVDKRENGAWVTRQPDSGR